MAVSMLEERQVSLEQPPKPVLVHQDEAKRLVREFESFMATDPGFDVWFKIASNGWHVTVVERCRHVDSCGAVIYCAEGFRFYPLSGRVPELSEREIKILTYSLDTTEAFEAAARSGVHPDTILPLIRHEAMLR